MKKIFLLFFLVFLLMPLSPEANTDIRTREDVFQFLKDAFHVQVSLSEQDRTKEEIKKLLNPYFSEGYQEIFWTENIVEENGKFFSYGSDFALYYIPFYKYNDDTKVIFEKNQIYVFEYFPASTEGPVGYDNHYEGILLKKYNGKWKVDQYLYDNIPKPILDQAYKPVKEKIALFSWINIRHLFF